MSAADHTSSEQFPVMYHATRHPLRGDIIHAVPRGDGDFPGAWASTNPKEAHRHAYRLGLIDGEDHPVRTYQVEPLSKEGLSKPLGAAWYDGDNYVHKEGFKVVGEVPTVEQPAHESWGSRYKNRYEEES
jgi:hypothetical protein